MAGSAAALASDARDRLQPALLDRLADDRRRHAPARGGLPRCALGQAALERLNAGHESAAAALSLPASTTCRPDSATTPPSQGQDEHRLMTKTQLREAVLRDLTWLLNAVQGLNDAQALASAAVAQSVLNYGLPALSGQLASRMDIPWLERTLRQAILRYEPRIIAASLRVQALEVNSVMDTHNVIEFEIHGELWAQPVPIDLLLRTQLDLEAGQVTIRDLTNGPSQPR